MLLYFSDLRKHPSFRKGFLDLLPMAPGIAAWGLMTGVAMVKLGLGTAPALLMALLVFAGSAQLASIPLLMAGAPLWVVAITVFCVNLRFVIFSAHLRSYVMHLGRFQRMLLGFYNGDLTYVQFVQNHPRPATDPAERTAQVAYLAGNGTCNWTAWTVFNLLGIVLANFIPAEWGLGFAGVLALSGMMWSLATTQLRWLSAAVSGTAAVVAFSLPLKFNMLMAICIAVVLCLAIEKMQASNPENAQP